MDLRTAKRITRNFWKKAKAWIKKNPEGDKKKTFPYVFEFKKFNIHTTAEISAIERKLTTSHYYNGIIVLTGGVNLEVEYALTENLSISMLNQFIYRNDLRIYNTKEKFVNSVFLMVTFKY
jgi:hypothetical protein